jgi:LemA protein
LDWVSLLGIGVVGLIVIVFVLVLVYYYNRIRVLANRIEEAWAQIDVQLKKRYDLVPNLVETVKGYAGHERDVLIKVTEARSRVGSAGTIDEKIEANNQLSSALARLLVVVERYPDLKANQNFIRLQDELAGTENRISVERRRYNEAVQSYNIKLRSFPENMLAGMFGFQKKNFFEAPQAAAEAPKVKF